MTIKNKDERLDNVWSTIIKLSGSDHDDGDMNHISDDKLDEYMWILIQICISEALNLYDFMDQHPEKVEDKDYLLRMALRERLYAGNRRAMGNAH